MKWIRLHNDGDFDVVTAVQMIGASVKTNDDPIGLYGSGIKYAMAQALRMGISIKIAVNGKVYTLTGKKKEFRGEEFTNVALREPTGKTHVTGITSEFGKEDWTEKWFIFREFYSNTLDESGTMEIVDGVQTTNGVEVFLPYKDFADMADNLDDYFTDREWTFREGTGRVFKKGVYIGQMDTECKFDVQSPGFVITEVRTMDDYHLWYRMSSMITRITDAAHWTLVLESQKIWEKLNLSLLFISKETHEAMKEGMIAVFGKNYAICPNIDWMVKDAIGMGYCPVVFPNGWELPKDKGMRLNHIEDMCSDLHYRDATDDEAAMVEKAVNIIRGSGFLAEDICEHLNIRIFKADIGVLGVNTLGTLDIGINEDNFKNMRKLMETLIHEANHIRTQAKDYTREFETGYADFILDLLV